MMMPNSLFFVIVLYLITASHRSPFFVYDTNPLSWFWSSLHIIIVGCADITSMPILAREISQPFILAVLPLLT